MLQHYHDKYPIGQKLQDLKENQAAFEMMSRNGALDYNEDKPKLEKKTKLLVCCMVALYLVGMILTTYQAKRDLEKSFEQNIHNVMRYIRANFDENEASSLNGIYDIGTTKEEYQYISAIVYNEDQEPVAVTDLYLCLPDNETEKKYAFLAEEIFEEHTIMELLSYVRNTSQEYTVEARINGETKQLLSLKFIDRSITSGSKTVWEWDSGDTCDDENLVVLLQKTPIHQIFSVPYKEIEDGYEKWMTVKFMYGTELPIETQDVPSVTYELSTFSSKNVGYVQSLSDVDEDGYLINYYMHVQSAGLSLKAAMDALAPTYVLGLAVLIVCISWAVNGRKNFKGKRLVICGVFLIFMALAIGNGWALYSDEKDEKTNEKFGITSEVTDFNEESFRVEFECEGIDTEEHLYVDTGPWHEIEKRTIFGWVKKELLTDGWMVGVVNEYDITKTENYELDVYYKWYYGKLRRGTYRVTNVIKTDNRGEEESVGNFYTTFKVK